MQVHHLLGFLGLLSLTNANKLFVPTNYTIVPGFFIQDSPGFNATGYNFLNDTFGLLDKGPQHWSRFRKNISDLNARADENTVYKVIYIARHGEGYHNVAESTYGTPAWNCYWSELTTDGNITWGPDAKLSPAGINAALAVNNGWKAQLKNGIPLPQTLYSSPLSRCTSTLNLTFSDILLSKIKPLIKENLRESIGLHTCDERANKTYIAKTYQRFEFESSFSEYDQQWTSDYEENGNQQARRTLTVLNEIFATDPSTYISITAHSGTITAFFTEVNHQPFGVQTGGMVPVVVKAVRYLNASQTVLSPSQSNTRPACTANPTTAVISPAIATVSATVINATSSM